MRGTFEHNNKLLMVILSIVFIAIALCVYFFCNRVYLIVFIPIAAITVASFSSINSSYKADNEKIIFMIGFFVKYNISISDIKDISIQPYRDYNRFSGSDYRVMIKINVKDKIYKFNNVFNVNKAIDDMLLRYSKTKMTDESLTRLYYYIVDKRKDLYATNKIDESI